MYVCLLTFGRTYICILYVIIYVYIKLNMSAYWCLQIHYHLDRPRLSLPLLICTFHTHCEEPASHQPLTYWFSSGLRLQSAVQYMAGLELLTHTLSDWINLMRGNHLIDWRTVLRAVHFAFSLRDFISELRSLASPSHSFSEVVSYICSTIRFSCHCRQSSLMFPDFLNDFFNVCALRFFFGVVNFSRFDRRMCHIATVITPYRIGSSP